MEEKKTYSDLLKNPKWQKKRLEIFKRDKFKCRLCGDTETILHVHHKKYINGHKPWEYDNGNLFTLCGHCHELVESQKDDFDDLIESKILKFVFPQFDYYIIYFVNRIDSDGLRCVFIFTNMDHVVKPRGGFGPRCINRIIDFMKNTLKDGKAIH